MLMDMRDHSQRSKAELIWVFVASSALISCVLGLGWCIASMRPNIGSFLLPWWPHFLILISGALIGGMILSVMSLSNIRVFPFSLVHRLIPIKKSAFWIVPMVGWMSLGIYHLSEETVATPPNTIESKWCQAESAREELEAFRGYQAELAAAVDSFETIGLVSIMIVSLLCLFGLYMTYRTTVIAPEKIRAAGNQILVALLLASFVAGFGLLGHMNLRREHIKLSAEAAEACKVAYLAFLRK